MSRAALLAVVALGIVGCHIDKLLNGEKPPPSQAPPARVAFSSSLSSARAGEPISPPVQVTVQDSTGRVTLRDTLVTLSLGSNPSGDSLRGSKQVRSVNGVATFGNLQLDKAASGYTLTAAAPQLAPDTSAAFSVMPATATTLAFTAPPSNTVQDSTIKPAVEVTAYDALGNKATNFTGPISVVIGTDASVSKNATLRGQNPVTAVAGVATFSDLRIDQPGVAYTLRAGFGSGTTPVATSAAFTITPSAVPTGTLNVTTSTSGASPDPNGYTFTVDGGAPQAIQNSQTIPLTLPTGSHTVQLGDVAANCTVTSGTSRTVTVAAGSPVTASFAVTCPTPPPTTGDLTVTAATTGGSPDLDGYLVSVDGGAAQRITINGSTTFTGLSAGSHSVTLGDLASNCTVSGANPRTVTVITGQTVTASFAVSCPTPPPLTGSLAVTTSTSGGTPDPDGYAFAVDGGTPQPITDNQSITLTGVATGSHTVVLSGIAANCTVTGGTSRTVTVTAGQTVTATFTVRCPTPPPPNQPPVAAFTSSCSQLTCTFTSTSSDPDGTIASYAWTFGDGTTATTQNPSHTYSAGGTFTVTLTVTDNQGATGNVSHTVTVTAPPPPNQPPTAAFTSSCTQLACSFTSTSSDPDGTIASYAWTFGDGGTATTQNPSHTYTTGGTFTVTLTVTDNQGATGNVSHTVTVTAAPPPNQPPTAAFTSSCTQLACSFTSTSSDPDGTIASYAWTFGDGGTATTQNPSHTYSAGGTFTVTLTVTDNQGATGNVSHQVTVSAPPPPNQPPVAAFTSSCTLLVCNFTSTSSDPDGTIASYAWTFGDGGKATTQNPSHTYTAGGTFTVTLTVTDNQGATGNVSHQVTVTAPPPPNQPPSVTAGGDQTVLVGALFTLSGAAFSDPDHDGPWTVTIDWGDGTSSTSTSPGEGSIGGSHSYPVTVLPHDYQLTVTVVDAHGGRGSATKTVHVVLL